MELLEHEKNSELWKKLSAHFNELLDKSRRENDKELDVIKTADLRGRIRILKQLINLSKRPLDQQTSDNSR